MKTKYVMIASVPKAPERRTIWQTRMIELLKEVPCFRYVYASGLEYVTLTPKGPSGEIIADPLNTKLPFVRAMREFAYGYPADGLGLVVLTESRVASLMPGIEPVDSYLVACDVANNPDMSHPVPIKDRIQLLSLLGVVLEPPGQTLFDYCANRPRKLVFPELPADYLAEPVPPPRVVPVPVVTRPKRPMTATSSPLTAGVRQRPRGRYGLVPQVS